MHCYQYHLSAAQVKSGRKNPPDKEVQFGAGNWFQAFTKSCLTILLHKSKEAQTITS